DRKVTAGFRHDVRAHGRGSESRCRDGGVTAEYPRAYAAESEPHILETIGGRLDTVASWFGSNTYAEAAREQSTLARVMGLLGLSAVFTAIGALFGPALGQVGFWVSLIGGLIIIV